MNMDTIKYTFTELAPHGAGTTHTLHNIDYVTTCNDKLVVCYLPDNRDDMQCAVFEMSYIKSFKIF
jgi:hypothetical protein